MSLYAVQNDEGKWLGVDRNGSDHWQVSHGDIYSGWFSANDRASVFGGHVVELVEAPEKVVVSEEEAEVLELANAEGTVSPTRIIMDFVASKGTPHSWALEDRLMRAYVNGWKVEKPKRYLIKVPHTDDSYFYKIDDEYCNAGDSYHIEAMTDKKWFTAAEIEHYGLQDCERVEVAEHDDD